MIMPRLSLRSRAAIVSVFLLVAVVRIEEGRDARARLRMGKDAMEAANTRAERASTRRVDALNARVARVLGDSPRLVDVSSRESRAGGQERHPNGDGAGVGRHWLRSGGAITGALRFAGIRSGTAKALPDCIHGRHRTGVRFAWQVDFGGFCRGGIHHETVNDSGSEYGESGSGCEGQSQQSDYRRSDA